MLLSFKRGELSQKDDPAEWDHVQRLLQQGEVQYIHFPSIVNAVERALIQRGMNPGGLYQVRHRDCPPWPQLFHDLSGMDLALRSRLEEFRHAYRAKLFKEVRMVITDSMGRDFESLGYGWLTYDRSSTHAPKSEEDVRLIDSIIRHLAFYYKTRSESAEGIDRFTRYYCKWLRENVNRLNGLSDQDLSDEVKRLLRPLAVIDDRFRLKHDRLFVHKPKAQFWECDLMWCCASVPICPAVQKDQISNRMPWQVDRKAN